MNEFIYLIRYLYSMIRWRLFAWVALLMIASLLEGLSISMILPILAGSESTDSPLYKFLTDGAELLGLPYTLPVAVAGMAILYLLRTSFIIYQRVYAADITGKLMARLKITLVEQVYAADYQYFLERGLSAFTNAVTVELGNVSRAFEHCNRFIANLGFAIVFIAIPMAINPIFSSIVIIVGVPGYFLLKRLFNVVRNFSIRSTAANLGLQSYIIQGLVNFKYLKATGSHPGIFGRIRATSREQGRLDYKQNALSAVLENSTDLFFMLVIAGLLLYFVEIQRNSLIEIGVILFIVRRAMVYSLNAQRSFQEFLRYSGSVREFQRLSDELSEREESVDHRGTAPDFDRPITLTNVSFGYGGSEKVLDNVSLTIPPNSMVAFVGASGAGKSTLVTMLTGLLRPTSGEIAIGGIPYDKLSQRKLREGIGYVTQESVIFNDTIHNNISLWDSESDSRDKVHTAARTARASDFIESLSEGYDSLLGDNGINISGGQRQRISIARELYKDASLLIFDEATSALDTESESEVQNSIDALRGNKTIILIAHRLSTIRNCDIIFVLK
ncbi:MAG: ABC transporter ATP-binding protein, partial [Dehalococcoidia bacterium]|nr:ABC transporter ATP-binding protein [Dehalococcoidia bacterium]